jgi:hypothetical protein
MKIVKQPKVMDCKGNHPTGSKIIISNSTEFEYIMQESKETDGTVIL